MIKMQNVAPKLSETPGAVRHVGPELGEHNDYVYREVLQLSDAEIEALSQGGHIAEDYDKSVP